jgi:hypothetical protein
MWTSRSVPTAIDVFTRISKAAVGKFEEALSNFRGVLTGKSSIHAEGAPRIQFSKCSCNWRILNPAGWNTSVDGRQLYSSDVQTSQPVKNQLNNLTMTLGNFITTATVADDPQE